MLEQTRAGGALSGAMVSTSPSGRPMKRKASTTACSTDCPSTTFLFSGATPSGSVAGSSAALVGDAACSSSFTVVCISKRSNRANMAADHPNFRSVNAAYDCVQVPSSSVYVHVTSSPYFLLPILHGTGRSSSAKCSSMSTTACKCVAMTNCTLLQESSSTTAATAACAEAGSVPRPNSSTKASVMLQACCNSAQLAFASCPNALRPSAGASEWAAKKKSCWYEGMLPTHGAIIPQFAKRATDPIARIKVLLPDMLGPVASAPRLPS
mmetsp:Transcript_35987/g.66133  ORF Transcript_35987/g.66133 Transcript_35987/m.66133 type:complete len:267 (-) Transcript_35987:2717-3517(-)